MTGITSDGKWVTFVNPSFASSQGEDDYTPADHDHDPYDGEEHHYGTSDGVYGYDQDGDEVDSDLRPRIRNDMCCHRHCRILLIATIIVIALLVIIGVSVGVSGGPELVGQCYGELCSGHGRCEELSEGPHCVCEPGYTGLECQGKDLCFNVTCSSNHECKMPEGGGTLCVCKAGYSGDNCQPAAKNPCDSDSQPCSNHGTCRDNGVVAACTCDTGYYGDHCETETCFSDSFSCQNGGSCVLEQDPTIFYRCNCQPGYLGVNCQLNYKQDEQVAFYAVADKSRTDDKTFQFDRIPVNNMSAFSNGTHCNAPVNNTDLLPTASPDSINSTLPTVPVPLNGTDNSTSEEDGGGPHYELSPPANESDCYSVFNFVAPSTGYYWFFYTLVWQGSTSGTLIMTGTDVGQPPAEVIRDHVYFNGTDTLSRHSVFQLAEGQVLNMTSLYPTYADATIGSSWGGVQLDVLMSPLVVFDVVSTDSQTDGQMHDVHLNVRNGWDAAKQVFVAAQDGVYYFFLSAGVPAYKALSATVSSSMSHTDCGLQMSDTSHNGIDLISRGCMLSLSTGEEVSISLGTNHPDTAYGETSLRGFLYSPAHQHNVAWAVHNSGLVSGNGSVMSFPTVTVNVGGAWNNASNTITVPLTGTYLIELVGATGVQGSIDMRLMLNSDTVLARLWSAGPEDSVTRSRSLLATLNATQTLSIAYDNVNMDGHSSNGISFQGMLLYGADVIV